MSGKEKNFSTSNGVALYKSMQNVNSSKEMVSYALVVAKGDPKTYKKADASQEEER